MPYFFRPVTLFLLILSTSSAFSQALSKEDLNRGLSMLKDAKEDVKNFYFDKTYRGIDLEARYLEAQAKVKRASTNGEVNTIIAQFLIDLNDSHTFFIPPAWAAEVDYGWQMQMIGEECFIVAVRDGSDAETKGIMPGDKVLSVDGFEVTRESMWKFQYYYNLLRPKTGIRLSIQSPDGEKRDLVVMSKVEKLKQKIDLLELALTDVQEVLHGVTTVGDDLFIWKLKSFDVTEESIDEIMKRAQNYKSLILDLRGNAGGSEKVLKRLLSHFFERTIVVGELKRRSETKLLKVEPRKRPFKGELVVLTDSHSGSASEVFARVVQLEKRGRVVGDRTSGAVMRSRLHSHLRGRLDIQNGQGVPYAICVTDADLIMSDGRSLEKNGVIPDRVLLPSPKDLLVGEDPVLSAAAGLLGSELHAKEAAKLFPDVWIVRNFLKSSNIESQSE
jgi:C-terminal processing protease CtpA/Prc